MAKLADGSFGNKKADDGKIWVCLACGKTSKDHYGENADRGWDESCMMNSEEILISRLIFSREDGRVIEIKPIEHEDGKL